MKKLAMVVVVGMMMIIMVGSSTTASLLEMGDENPLNNIIRQELKSSTGGVPV